MGPGTVWAPEQCGPGTCRHPLLQQSPRFQSVIAVIASSPPKSTAQNGWESDSAVWLHEFAPQLVAVFPSMARLGSPPHAVVDCQAVRTRAAGQTEEVGHTLGGFQAGSGASVRGCTSQRPCCRVASSPDGSQLPGQEPRGASNAGPCTDLWAILKYARRQSVCTVGVLPPYPSLTRSRLARALPC